MADASARQPRGRWGSFRTWEIVVIAIAILLFVLAAFAGPGTQDPSAVPPPSPDPSASPGSSPTDVPTGSPVASVDQILTDDVGAYVLADRNDSRAGLDSGALQSVELRYELRGRGSDTDIFHAIEIHRDEVAASERVKMFGAALEQTGYEKLREQSLRNDDGSVQGYFISLLDEGQPLLLWSNRNATFSLGGGPEADVNAFYEGLPY